MRILNANLDKKWEILCIANEQEFRSCRMRPQLDPCTSGAAILSFAAVLGGLAATLALAGVFAFATVVAGLTSSLSFTRILPFATMFAFVLVGQVVDGGDGHSGDACGVRPHCEGSG